MPKVKEECGVFGVFAPESINAADMVYRGLFALQHRGQESCGIVVNDDGVFTAHKDLGLVGDVFGEAELDRLGTGSMAIGHVRYATCGANDRNNAQPIVANHSKGRLALAHNGNLVNSYELRREIEESGAIFHTTSDTEVISYIITRERLTSGSIEEAVDRAMRRIRGAYSLLMMSPAKLIAARDENGFRPLCFGRCENGIYVVASESCALDAVGAKLIRDIEPGEILVFGNDGIRSIKSHCLRAPKKTCVFEYIYFARPDSVIDGYSVHEARVRAGKILAGEHPVEADAVIGVPDSGLDAAIGYSEQSGIPYRIGLIKNKYIGRTFIAPGQENRMNKVRLKLNPVSSVVKGKRIVLIDDSIVRGTTCALIVRLLREAGAKEIHMRISAPPFMHPCYYGTDIDSEENLIACKYSVDEIARTIGADSLGFLSLSGARSLVGGDERDGFCTACFDGSYPTEIPQHKEKSRFEKKISEK